ncbi:MAG: carboxymuconolactone decarboxylase family protein [Calditrichia bacterium]
MSRLNPVELTNAEGKAKELLTGVKQAMGATPNIFTTMANAPAALDGYLKLNGALSAGSLSSRLREQIALTVAGLNGCNYCASAHTYLGERTGLNAEELERNMRGQSEDIKTQAALVFAAKLVETRGRVIEGDLAAVLKAGFSREDAIEIVAHVALNVFTNYFNETFKTEVDFPHVSTESVRKAG